MTSSLDLATARAEDFQPHVGSALQAAEANATLTLASVDRVPPRPGAPRPEPFTLVFAGPRGIGQGILRLDHAVLGTLELFVVPIGPGPDGLHRYEATFN